MTIIRLFLFALLANAAALGSAHAVAITAIAASTVSTAPFAVADFGTVGTSGLVSSSPIAFRSGRITFGAGGAGAYSGGVSGVAAAPDSSGRTYLAAEPGSVVSFAFDTPQQQFRLLWGSVDDYNSLTFGRLDGTSVTVTGADVLALTRSGAAAYVTISGLGAFNRVIATSSSPAFEFVPDVAVPEPGTLALLGAGLGALAVWRRRAKS